MNITLPKTQEIIEVEIKRKNMKTVRLKVLPNKTVTISSPLNVSDEWLVCFINEKRDWIEKKLEEFKKTTGYEKINKLQSGMSTKIVGRDVRIIINQCQKNFCYREKDTIIIGVKDKCNQALIDNTFEKWWRVEATNLYNEILNKHFHIIGKYDVKIPLIIIKKMKTLWGSCSVSKEKVTLNYYLMKAPLYCIEYVILHELVHFIYPNHSKEFYNFLSIHMPDWKERKKKLDYNVVMGI